MTSFDMKNLGNLNEGRPNLGNQMNVMVYRLFQYSLRNILTERVGEVECNLILYESGNLAGIEFYKDTFNSSLDFYTLISELQKLFRELGIGILRIEESNLMKFNITLSIEEDIDCSGMTNTGKVMCHFDEGFLSGIMSAYTGNTITAKEIECWGTGSQTCRFNLRIKQ